MPVEREISRKILIAAVDFSIRFATSKVVVFVFVSSKSRLRKIIVMISLRNRSNFGALGHTRARVKLIRRGNTYLLCNKRGSCPRVSFIGQ